MATNNNIISFGVQSDVTIDDASGVNGQALKSCRPILAKSLPNCIASLSGLDDILFKLADKATTQASL